jgi:hypothetical protein
MIKSWLISIYASISIGSAIVGLVLGVLFSAPIRFILNAALSLAKLVIKL